MADSLSASDRLTQSLIQLRSNLTDGEFLRTRIYNRDESRFVENTYTYWVRLERDADSVQLTSELVPDAPGWMAQRLQQTLFDRLPDSFSTLARAPLNTPPEDSVSECLRRRDLIVAEVLPASIPYAACHAVIARCLRSLSDKPRLLPEHEAAMLLHQHSRAAIQTARRRHPEVWDEVRGDYVLDSRGAPFGKSLVESLASRNWLTSTSRFIDLGCGVGTMLFAVNRYSSALATGIERHAGVCRIARSVLRRLDRKKLVDRRRIRLLRGDFTHPEVIDLGRFDVCYVYSPLGKWVIDVDAVIHRLPRDSLLITRDISSRQAGVERIGDAVGLGVYRVNRD